MAKRKPKEHSAESPIETQDVAAGVAGSFSLPPDIPLAEPVGETRDVRHEPSHESPSPAIDRAELTEGKKQWAERANPWPSLSYHWPDYQITLQERTWTRETQKPNAMQIKFGSGSRENQPKAFGQIKEILKARGYGWDKDDQCWSRWLKSGKTREGRVENSRIREESLKLVAEVVKIEEGARGAATGKPGINHFPTM